MEAAGADHWGLIGKCGASLWGEGDDGESWVSDGASEFGIVLDWISAVSE